jgi:general secretion pathway protein N
MFNYFKALDLALLSSLILVVNSPAPAHAVTSATLDVLPNSAVETPADAVDVGSLKPLVRPDDREKRRPLLTGNPLWAVPLSVLTATQERPIFSASRRPPPRAVAGPRIEPVAAPVPKSLEPEQPPFALIGTVLGDGDALAVFLDRTNQGVVRLRLGDARSGWVLSAIERREVTLRKAELTETLVLQRVDGPQNVSRAPAIPIPGTNGLDTSFAPFAPRSTPKNGESDGL